MRDRHADHSAPVVKHQRDALIDAERIEQRFEIENSIDETIRIALERRFVRKAAPDVIESDATVRRAQSLDETAEIERPRGVSVDHDDRIADAFVHVMEFEPAAVEVFALEWKKRSVYHSTPSIRQLSPLPMPSNPTRSPRRRNSRSSAKAAVSGSDTVPMLPRN